LTARRGAGQRPAMRTTALILAATLVASPVYARDVLAALD
jgi:hypothetical protein